MAEIKFENVKKRFKGNLVIKGINLTINNGEFFTFVGPSGCGKSTILNMAAGLEPVTEGRIYFDGVIVNDLSPRERDASMVFQSYALYPHMTVYKNIAFPLKMKKMKENLIDKEVKRVAEIIGIQNLLKRKPASLSGGERQRVALGRAIVRKPKVFLMDEPLSNLDARLRVEMRSEHKKLHQELGITTIYVTHDQAEAMSLSGRIAVLNKGEIQQCSTPNEVYLKPANIFVAGFIGSPTMNFIPALVKEYNPLKIDCNGIILSPKFEKLPERESVIVGIRPEEIRVSFEKTKKSIEVSILLIEPAGPFNWVDVIWGNTKIKGMAQLNQEIKLSDKAFVEFSEDSVFIFDKESTLLL